MNSQLGIFSLIKNYLKTLLYSVVLIPVSAPDSFLDLKYRKGTPNRVDTSKSVTIFVDKSASPLFYKMPIVSKVKKLKISGSVNISKKIMAGKDDTYFQLGIIYAGSYRPFSLTKIFLPDWLKIILNFHGDFGLGDLDFFDVSVSGSRLNKVEKVGDVDMNFKTFTHLKKDNTFSMEIVPKNEKILGFWLRADGDDSNAIFQTQINYLLIHSI